MEYFGKVFAEPAERSSDIQMASPTVVFQEHNKMLTADVNFEEFTEAIRHMHPDKASIPNGLNPAFFQNFWKVVGNEVFECCKGWLAGEAFPVDLNHTNVVLIPKKENICSLKDLWPIALCNVLYKILAKVLANRLKNVI